MRRIGWTKNASTALIAMALGAGIGSAAAEPLGLPPVPIPSDNPQTPEKIALGDKLFHDQRFSIDGTVSCATCHDGAKAFTDSPLKTSQGHNKLTGTRNAPTVLNAAYFTSMFWDGRSSSLEDQSQFPMVNPVEMGLTDHAPVLKIVREDPAYVEGFKKAFGKSGKDVSLEEVKKAIAAFERTVISGDSPFDRWYFGGDANAMSAQAKRGFDVFIGQGRCVSCHVVEQTQALFTDNKFHNIGVGINRIQSDIPKLAGEFLKAKSAGADVDKAVLADPKTSDLGRFAVTNAFDEIGGFKTSTLRNIALTAPYMHDGSLKTLKDVVKHYNEGGKSPGDPFPVNPYLSGGIRPLDLTDRQIDDLVSFLEALTSPSIAAAQKK
ncbi:cytochrome-c peroxidase [Methylocystis parvus]|uniref:Methylamine utilization protein MauG n=1 Tax=Methylocystis parvus TaxID=134 RepID=A0A6B8M4T8_9HYPH|nr:cytochrome c peroxidase [Methylocystis parvus]QGM98964.1 cytochrome-c peroxidase [Methylocystis parvus]WBK00676.1 cytochrome-c peroxidase [Methylocystis parvus OBBP]